MEISIKRATLIITQKCSLRCKLCLAFIPYFENPRHTKLQEAERIIDNFFSLVNTIETFSITGGEPLLNPDLNGIISYALQYKKQITGTLDIVTNGTIMFSKELLDIFEENRAETRVIISNYGKLSPKVSEIEKELVRRGINYRIQNYDVDSDNWTYDGWVDFSDHSLKHVGEIELKKQALRCIFRRGHYYVINDGELHPCSRQYWRMRIGVLERDDAWFINLNAENFDINREKEKLQTLENVEYLKSCAYCNGCYNGIARSKPAEQITNKGDH